MIRDYQFKNIEKYLKKDSKVGKDILDAFGYLTDAAIIFTPIVFGPKLLPLLGILDVKDKLVNIGHIIHDAIINRVETNYLDRMEQISAAYALICYTSYFDNLQNALPSDVRKKLALNFNEQKRLMEESAATNNNEPQLPPAPPDIRCNVYFADHATSFHDIKEHLSSVYRGITHGLIKMISDSSVFDKNRKGKEAFTRLKEALDQIPEAALRTYEAQYLTLADHFNDFALFAQLQNFEGIHQAIKDNRQALDQLGKMTKSIDVGLRGLNQLVNSISTNYSRSQLQSIVDDLKNKYRAILEEPIIDAKEITPEGERISLQFPKIVDAFIPQSYKCLCYQEKDTLLESDQVWKKVPIQYELDKFFIKYLYSPDSVEYPLIIMGQPGSGKSLLTKVLAAQLIGNSYVVIRIPLRDVNAQDNIDVLVEDQIKKLTSKPLSVGYGGFAEQFSERPLIIILDGYDELLQAKGEVFSGYLENARRFQNDQKAMGRPVRIIITSRITLINKARIPLNATILRLMEFNPKQRQAWIDIWNQTNANYFATSNTKPFQLPTKEEGKRNSIIELAEQPLLLLMLALYDSESNELAQASNIKRTELYDNLIRRFVRRERSRYVSGFVDMTPGEQEVIIEGEMNRLGVAAIGMYNRQDVVIRATQLEKDLDTFQAHRSDEGTKTRTLKESVSMIGGFFFINKSTAKDFDAHSDNSESAYEFLHNTFGEFLTADFILRNLIKQATSIYIDRQYKPGGQTKMSNPDLFDSNWFYCLMFVPLYSRPVVIEMLREHREKALQRFLRITPRLSEFTQEVFEENLNFILKNQLKMVLETRNLPAVMCNGILFDRDIPLLGYLAIYSLNLVTLACVLSPNGFEFVERDYYTLETTESTLSPWSKLASLWKSWFSSSDLVGLSVILKAKRKDRTTVLVECNEKFEATRYEQPVDILLCVSSTLADNLLTGLSGLHTRQFHEITKMNAKDISRMLEGDNPDLYVAYLITLLRKEVNSHLIEHKNRDRIHITFRTVNDIIEMLIHNTRMQDVNEDTLLTMFEILECCVQRNIVFLSTRRDLVHFLLDRLEHTRYFARNNLLLPEQFSIVQLLQLLINNNDLLALSVNLQNSNLFNREIILDTNWFEDDIARVLHYLPQYVKSNELSYLYNRNLDPLLDSHKRFLILNASEKENIFEHVEAEETLNTLLEADPESVTCLMLNRLNNEKRYYIKPRIIDSFLNSSFNLLSSVGIGYFGFNATINTILIAIYTKDEMHLLKIKNILQKQLFCGPKSPLIPIIYYYPSFISNLINLLPDIFLDLSLLDIRTSFLERNLPQYIPPYKFPDYIKVFRGLYQLSDRLRNLKMFTENTLHLLTHLLSKDYISELNLSQLTLGQLSDLYWYALFARVKPLTDSIESVLSRFGSI